MMSCEQSLEYYRSQTNKQKVYDALKIAREEIVRLEAILHRSLASVPCILRSVDVAMSIVAALPDENFIVKEKE